MSGEFTVSAEKTETSIRYYAAVERLDHHMLRPGGERRLRAIQRAFRALHAKWDWSADFWRALRQRLRQWGVPVFLGVTLGVGIVAFIDLSDKFGSDELAARHLLAVRNCDAARAAGLAPAHRGDAGYYQHHDRDNDGIACEPYDAP